MKHEAEARVSGAVRGGIYDDVTETFYCHCPKPQEFKLKPENVTIFYDDIGIDDGRMGAFRND